MENNDDDGELTHQLVVSLTEGQVEGLIGIATDRNVGIGSLLRDVGRVIAAQVDAGETDVAVKHNKKYSMRVSERDFDRISRAAAAAGLKPSAWLREAALANLRLEHLSPYVRSTTDGVTTRDDES